MKTWTLVFRAIDKDRFEELHSGIKMIETRAASPRYQHIAVGDEITFKCGKNLFSKKISKTYHWPSVSAMVKEISFKEVMPNVNSVKEMKAVYASYPGYAEKIKEFGVLGLEFVK